MKGVMIIMKIILNEAEKNNFEMTINVLPNMAKSFYSSISKSKLVTFGKEENNWVFTINSNFMADLLNRLSSFSGMLVPMLLSIYNMGVNFGSSIDELVRTHTAKVTAEEEKTKAIIAEQAITEIKSGNAEGASDAIRKATYKIDLSKVCKENPPF